MTTKLAKVTRFLQTVSPVLVMLHGALAVFSVRDEAQNYPGPPFYLPFIFLIALLSAILGAAAFFLWVWKPLGWCLSVLMDMGFSLSAAWILFSDLIHKRAVFSFDAVLLAVAIWFGLISVLLFSRQSLAFFQVTETSAVDSSQAF